MSFRLKKRNNRFYLRGKNPIKKIKGFPFDGWKFTNDDGWYCINAMSALPLREYADEHTENFFKSVMLNHQRWGQALTIPKNKTLLDHQPKAIKFCLSRNRSYLNAKPGLGKTIIASIVAATLFTFGKQKGVYLCPPFLTYNVLEELKKWAPKLNCKIMTTQDWKDWEQADLVIIPDSQIERKKMLRVELKLWLEAFAPDYLIIDEAHRYKTDTAGMTRALNGFTDKRRTPSRVKGILDLKSIKKVINMSGTPAPNGRPIELFPLLIKQAPQFIGFSTKEGFGLKYCSAYSNGFGLTYDGVHKKNFARLMNVVQTDDAENKTAFMLRQKKSLLGLKKPMQEIVVLSKDMSIRLRRDETKILKKYSPEDLVKKFIAMKAAVTEEELQLATYRRMLGIEKATTACEYTNDILNNYKDKVMIFAVHTEVVNVIEDKLSKHNPFIITGRTPQKKRPAIIKEYLKSKKRPLVGNIDCLGLGHNILGVDRIQFYEWLFTPSKNSQAIDRAYRYGMKKILLVEWLALRHSFDHKSLSILDRKENILKLI